jgi:drug/metabolite transporter (DMT)-like permease
MTTGITAAVILSLLPVAVCVAEAIFLKEHTTLLQKVFLAAGICGVIYISLNTTASGGKDSVAGILLLILGNIMGALYFVFSRKSSKNYSAMEITYTSACMGMVAFNLVNIVRHLIAGNIGSYFAPYMSVENLIGFFFLAVVCTIFATAMNNFALSGMQASTMSAFSGLSTFVTIIAGVIFNNETIYYFHYIGLSLILVRMIGVSVIQIKKDKKSASYK